MITFIFFIFMDICIFNIPVELPNYSTESELQYDATEEIFDNEITQRSQVFTASMIHNGAFSHVYSDLAYITIFIQICLAMLYT